MKLQICIATKHGLEFYQVRLVQTLLIEFLSETLAWTCYLRLTNKLKGYKP